MSTLDILLLQQQVWKYLEVIFPQNASVYFRGGGAKYSNFSWFLGTFHPSPSFRSSQHFGIPVFVSCTNKKSVKSVTFLQECRQGVVMGLLWKESLPGHSPPEQKSKRFFSSDSAQGGNRTFSRPRNVPLCRTSAVVEPKSSAGGQMWGKLQAALGAKAGDKVLTRRSWGQSCSAQWVHHIAASAKFEKKKSRHWLSPAT